MQFDIFNPNKLLAHTETMQNIVNGVVTPPVTVSIDPSAECNQSCIWCSGRGFVNKFTDKLSKEVLIRLPKELAEYGVKGVFFTGGGDPMCNPYTADCIRECAEHELDIGLITNGMAMTNEVAYLMVHHGSFVRISIDASSPTTYSKLHQVDTKNFHIVVGKINMLIREKKAAKSNCQIGISFLIHPENMIEIESFYRLGKILGVDYVQFKPVIMGKWITSEQEAVIVRRLKACQLDAEGRATRLIINFQRIRHENSKYERLYTECLGQHLVGTIMATGKLCVCCQHRANKRFWFGNIHERSFKEIWESEERKMISRTIDVSKCPSCKMEQYNQMLHLMKNPPQHSNFL